MDVGLANNSNGFGELGWLVEKIKQIHEEKELRELYSDQAYKEYLETLDKKDDTCKEF